MQDIASHIDALGATLVAITPQTIERTLHQLEQNPLDYDVLTDRGNRFADALRIRFRLPDYLVGFYQSSGVDLPSFNGDDSWTLPMPARFVVDQLGTIRFAEANSDYTRRPEPSDTLEVLREICGG